jgi:hypothetical protein
MLLTPDQVVSVSTSGTQQPAFHDLAVVGRQAVEALHADQIAILEHLRDGAQGWLSVRRCLYVLGSETRASVTRCQLAELVDRGLIEEFEDSRYRLTAAGRTATE